MYPSNSLRERVLQDCAALLIFHCCVSVSPRNLAPRRPTGLLRHSQVKKRNTDAQVGW